MSRVTIKDIAKKADVSIATVSYVINQNRYVSPELTARVQDAVGELGYFPDEIARSLRSKRTTTIGLIVPDNANPFFAEIAKGVEDAGFDAGYSVILCNSNAMLERELAYLEVLQSKRVDGIILISTTAELEHVRPIVKRGIPTAIFYRHSGDLNVDTYTIDNRHAGFVATKHLLDLGHTEIACILPLSPTNPSWQRVEGYKQALKERGIEWRHELMPQGDNLISGGERAAKALLEAGTSFSAVFSSNDAMAIGAMSALQDGDLRVPDDISLVGFDDITLASYSNPSLTTIGSPKYNAGHMAVEHLLERISGSYQGGPRDINLDVQLIVRKSTAPYQKE